MEIGITGPAGPLGSGTRTDEGIACTMDVISGIAAVMTIVVVSTLCAIAVVMYSVCAAL